MSFIKDVFFGGAEKEAAEQQASTIKEGQEFIRQSQEQARSDIFNIFPQAQAAALGGFQNALDVFNQSVPQQAQMLQGGNVAAQEALLAGLPAMQAAILGTQMPALNLGTFSLTPQFDFLNQTIQQPGTVAPGTIPGINPDVPIQPDIGMPRFGGGPGFGINPIGSGGGGFGGFGGGFGSFPLPVITPISRSTK